MRNSTEDFFDFTDLENDIEQQEVLDRLLILEELSQAEIELSPSDKTELEQSEAPERTLLKRDIRKAAIARMESAARTQRDFEEVIQAWDREDSNRERRERYHEVGRDEVPLEYGMSPDEIVIPAPIHSVYWRQAMKGDFLDLIFDCPYDIHEMVTSEDICRILKELTDRHKELLYFLVIRDYSTSKIAALYEQSDRNIRKVRATIERIIHRKLLPKLKERAEKKYPLTIQEREYLEIHCEA